MDSYNITMEQLPDQLARISRSALKPWQKFILVRDYLLAKYLFRLQAPNITSKTLEAADRIIRLCVKRWLHIPKQTPNSFLYAPVRFGGLGLLYFNTRVSSL